MPGNRAADPPLWTAFGRADHRLGRNATDIHTGAADRSMPDECHPLVGLGRGDRGGEPGRACSNHDQVIAVAAGVFGRAAIMRLDGLVHFNFFSWQPTPLVLCASRQGRD